MKTIWKYPLKLTEVQQIELPQGSDPLTVQMQDHRPRVWAIVDPKEPIHTQLTFYIIGTGEPFDETNKKYLGTIQQTEFVWHVFVA